MKIYFRTANSPEYIEDFNSDVMNGELTEDDVKKLYRILIKFNQEPLTKI